MCLHQKNYKHKAAYFIGNQVKFSTPSESLGYIKIALGEFNQNSLFVF